MAGKMIRDKIPVRWGIDIEEESEYYRSFNEAGFWQMPNLQN
mgnify:CR=1 FL=1